VTTPLADAPKYVDFFISESNGVLLRFPEATPRRLRVQVREDGVSVDQIVLSAVRYRTTRPGRAKNDNTILPITQPSFDP
jgi:hypothetical protein